MERQLKRRRETLKKMIEGMAPEHGADISPDSAALLSEACNDLHAVEVQLYPMAGTLYTAPPSGWTKQVDRSSSQLRLPGQGAPAHRSAKTQR
jgi:hypothetical protein